jgi:hypothetical protein
MGRVQARGDFTGPAQRAARPHLADGDVFDPLGDDVWEAGIAYPPGGHNRTGMVMCRTCFRYIPPQAIGSEGICYECWTEGMRLTAMVFLPSSSSVVRWEQV